MKHRKIDLMMIGCWLFAASVFAQTVHPRGGKLIYLEHLPASQFNRYDAIKDRGVTDRLFSVIYEGLVRYNFESDNVVPLLALSWEYGPGNRSLTFELRPNVMWHDGRPFTAKDVEFTYRYLLSKQRFKQDYSFISDIEIVDDHTVRFLFASSESDVLGYFYTWIIPKHRFDDNFMPIEDGNQKTLNTFPIGTGPYAFVNRTLDGNIKLAINDKYWGDEAHIETLGMFVQPDPSQDLPYIFFGRVNCLIQVRPNDIAEITSRKEFNLTPYDSYKFKALAHNCENPMLADARVRRAITMGCDRQNMLDEYYAGKGSVIFGPFVKYAPYYHRKLQPLEYSPKGAKQLLQEAGYEDRDGDGILENEQNEEMRFTMVTRSSGPAISTENQHVAANFVDEMKTLGIVVENQTLDIDQYLMRVFREHDFDIAQVDWEFNTGYDITDLFLSTENYPDGNNFISYNNPRVDQLLVTYLQSDDRERRRNIMYSLQEILRQDCPYTFLFNLDNYTAMETRYVNVRIAPYYFFTYLPEWYIMEGREGF